MACLPTIALFLFVLSPMKLQENTLPDYHYIKQENLADNIIGQTKTMPTVGKLNLF